MCTVSDNCLSTIVLFVVGVKSSPENTRLPNGDR